MTLSHAGQVLLISGLWIRTGSTRMDPDVFLNPDPHNFWIRIHKGKFEDKFFFKVLKNNIKVKNTCNLYYFLHFSYKNVSKVKEKCTGTFFSFSCPWIRIRNPNPEPQRHWIRIQSGSGSATLVDLYDLLYLDYYRYSDTKLFLGSDYMYGFYEHRFWPQNHFKVPLLLLTNIVCKLYGIKLFCNSETCSFFILYYITYGIWNFIIIRRVQYFKRITKG
jgi:hypothetical protein